MRFVASLEMIVKDVPSVSGLLVCQNIDHTNTAGFTVWQDDPDVGGGVLLTAEDETSMSKSTM